MYSSCRSLCVCVCGGGGGQGVPNVLAKTSIKDLVLKWNLESFGTRTFTPFPNTYGVCDVTEAMPRTPLEMPSTCTGVFSFYYSVTPACSLFFLCLMFSLPNRFHQNLLYTASLPFFCANSVFHLCFLKRYWRICLHFRHCRSFRETHNCSLHYV
jgi:hypothetical protein